MARLIKQSDPWAEEELTKSQQKRWLPVNDAGDADGGRARELEQVLRAKNHNRIDEVNEEDLALKKRSPAPSAPQREDDASDLSSAWPSSSRLRFPRPSQHARTSSALPALSGASNASATIQRQPSDPASAPSPSPSSTPPPSKHPRSHSTITSQPLGEQLQPRSALPTPPRAGPPSAAASPASPTLPPETSRAEETVPEESPQPQSANDARDARDAQPALPPFSANPTDAQQGIPPSNPWAGHAPKPQPFTFHQDERELVKNLLLICALDLCAPRVLQPPGSKGTAEAREFLANDAIRLKRAFGFGDSIFAQGTTKRVRSATQHLDMPWYMSCQLVSISLEEDRSASSSSVLCSTFLLCFSGSSGPIHARRENDQNAQQQRIARSSDASSAQGVHCMRDASASSEQQSILFRLHYPDGPPEEQEIALHSGESAEFNMGESTKSAQMSIITHGPHRKQLSGSVTIEKAKLSGGADDYLVHLSSGDDVTGSARVQITMHDRGPKCGGRLANGTGSITRYYDILLDAALRDSGFTTRVLELDPSWNWLLDEFAERWKINQPYRKLRYLLHVAEVSTPTVDCLDILRRELPSVTQRANESNKLSDQETRMLSEVRERLNKLFEKTICNFKLLDESFLSGIASAPGVTSTGLNEGALRLTTQLFEMVNDMTSADSHKAVQKCIRDAARGCCDRAHSVSQQNESPAGSGFSEYEGLRTFCELLRSEAERDIQVEKQLGSKRLLPGNLSGDARLPALTGAVYASYIKSSLDSNLQRRLPRHNCEHVQDAIDELSQFESVLSTNSLLYTSSGTRISSVREQLDPFVREWLSSFRRKLMDSVRETQAKGLHGGSEALRAAESWSLNTKQLLNEHERTLTRWPDYAPEAEGALAEAISAILSGLQRQVQPHIKNTKNLSSQSASGQVKGMFRMMSRAGSFASDNVGGTNGSSSSRQASRSRTRGSAASFEQQSPQSVEQGWTESSSPVTRLPSELVGALVALKVIDTEQAALKAALFRFAGTSTAARRHESTSAADAESTGGSRRDVASADLEYDSTGTAETRGDDADEAMYLGQHFDAKLQPGVRTLYKTCLQEAVARISRPVISDPHTSPRLILRHLGRDRIHHHVKPLESAVASVVRDCATVTGSARATVALARGFWDKLAGEVLNFVTDEMKNKATGWQKATAAASMLESIRKAVRDAITESVGDARESDYQDTTNAREASSLLGNNPYSSLHVY